MASHEKIRVGVSGPLRAVGDLGSHWIDLAQYVTGQTARQVLADLATFVPVRQSTYQ